MAESTTPRLGLTRWTEDTDTPNRTEFDSSHANLEDRAAGALLWDSTGEPDAIARPAAAAAYDRFIAYDRATGEVTICVDTTGAGGWAWVGPYDTRDRNSAAYVNVSGDTMTGNFVVDGGAITANQDADAQARLLSGMVGRSVGMLDLRNLTSPPAAGAAGLVRFLARNSDGVDHEYSRIVAYVEDTTATLEDARVDFAVRHDGVLSVPVRLLRSQALLLNGSAAAPPLSFQADQDTGIYRYTADGLGIALAGALAYQARTGHFSPEPDNAKSLGVSTRRWTEVFAVNGTINTSDINEKTDVAPIPGNSALDRVLRTAANAITFKWRNGKRTHAGFSAQGVGQEHGDDTAAYIDPAVEANARTNPYAAAEPTAEWYADYVDDDADADEQTEQRAEAEAEWVEAREEFDRETEAMRNAPKGIRPAELIPDLYAAIAEQQRQIEALTARVEALEAK
jgi:hypothetical protein